jgi:hypothetical protein
MDDTNKPLPLDDNQSEESTDQNEQVADENQQTTQDTPSDADTITDADYDNQDNREAEKPDDSLSRSEKRQQRYAERMADRVRSQAEQDAQAGRQLFSNNQNYEPLKYQNGEYDLDQLEQDRRQYGQDNFNKGVQQGTQLYELERFGDRLETDIDRVLTKHELTEKREQMLLNSYLREVGAQEDANGRLTIARPNLRFRDFAEDYIGQLDEVIQEELSRSSKNLVSQAARTGVRPNGNTRNSLSNLSDNDLVVKLRESQDDDETQKLLKETRRRANQALGL